MRVRGISLALAAVAAAGTPTVAAAPTVSVDRPCYTPGEPIRITGSGFTASGGVSLLFNLDLGHDPPDVGSATTRADSSGALAIVVRSPDVDRRPRQQVALAADDDELIAHGAGADTAVGAATFWISRLGVVPRPRGEPRHRISFHAVGWEAAGGGTLFAHYLHGARVVRGRVTGGVLVRTVRLGALSGPCGDLRVTMREFPFRPVAAGDWTIDFSTTAAWPARARVHWGYTHVIVPRGEAAP